LKSGELEISLVNNPNRTNINGLLYNYLRIDLVNGNIQMVGKAKGLGFFKSEITTQQTDKKIRIK